jgi:hypothetical protein
VSKAKRECVVGTEEGDFLLRRCALEFGIYGWRWRYDRELNTLTTHAGGFPYEVDLDRVTTPADVACWLHHLSEKGWVDNDLLGQFLRAVECVGGIGWYTRVAGSM